MLTRDERKPNNISRLATRALLFNEFLRRGIRTEDELFFYVSEFLHFYIPDHSVCTHHTTPARALSDIFFERKDSTFLFGCVVGSTRVYGPTFPKGRSIKSLVGESPFVYTYNFKEERIGVEQSFNIRKTANSVKVLQITLDDGRYLRLTPDHKFLLWEGTWKRADNLIVGEALMPFYRKIVSIQECSEKEDVYDMEVPATSCYVAEGVVIHNSRSSGKTRLLSILNNCVPGYTKIQCPRDYKKYPEGIPIKDLVGKEFWVYSYDLSKNKLVLSWAKDVGLRRKKVPVYKVSFHWLNKFTDLLESSFIQATDDHEFMLSGKEYKKVRDLVPGDCLMYFGDSLDCSVDAYSVVTSVEFSGHKDVYCMEVEDTHNFMTSHICIKNCEATFKPKIQICVDKDTPIDCLRDTKKYPVGIPIKDLVGKEFWVYSFSIKNQKVELKKGHNVHSQGYKECVRIEYSWCKGECSDFIIVDNNHEILLRGGLIYKKAKDIQQGDSLMPLVREWDSHKYPYVYAPGVRRTHRQNLNEENHMVTGVSPAGLREVLSLTVEDNHNYAAKGLFHKNCNAGAILSQAQKNYEYTLSYYEDDLLASTLKNSIQSHTELINGSVISVISGSARGLNGQHPAKLRLDEVELIDWMCFSGLSRVDVVRDKSLYPDGVPIKDLVGKPDQYVYCYDVKTKKFHIRKIVKVKKTGFKKVIKISYWWLSGRKTKVRKEGFIKVTLDHKMMLFDGTYKEAGLLKINDRLKAFAQIKLNPGKHPRINVSPTLTNIVESRFIWEEVYGPISNDYVVHHKDRNNWNSNLDNLELMTYAEHLYEHHHGVKRSESAKEKMRLAAKNRGQDWKDKLKKAHAKTWKAKEVQRPWTDKELLIKELRQVNNVSDLAKKWDCNLETIRVWSRKHGLPYRSSSKYVPEENHKVFKIEECEPEDVYSIEVEEHHNLVVNGVVAKNCIQEAFSMTQGMGEWKAQDTLSSTRKFSYGSVQRLLDEAVERQIEVYPWCIWESLAQCTRQCKADPIYGDCPIYSTIDVKTQKERIICGGKAHTCVVGSTFIDMPRDVKKYPKGIPIKDLVGKEFKTYGYDIKKRKFVIRDAYNVRLIQKNAETLTVTFGWYGGKNKSIHFKESITVTPDHRFLLRNGSYKRADQLSSGDRLQRFYRRLDHRKKGTYTSIEVKNRVELLEHWVVIQELEKKRLDYPLEVVHHRNFNGLDNSPDNLERMTSEDHRKFHSVIASKYMEGDNNPMKNLKNISKCVESNKKYWSSLKGQERKNRMRRDKEERARNTLESLTSSRRAKQDARKTLGITLTKRQVSQSVKEGIKSRYTKEELSQRQVNNINSRWRDHNKFEVIVCKNCGAEKKVLKSQKRIFCSLVCFYSFMVGSNNPNFKDGKHCANHTVISVEPSKREDVYCMTVDEVHNFVANGVVIENCKGWYSIDDFIKKVKLLDKQTWESQWLCLSGMTEIDTLKGKIKIKDLVGERPLVYSIDLNNKSNLVSNYASRVWMTQKDAPVYEVVTSGGIIKATKDHRFLLDNDDYKEVKYLVKGDRIKSLDPNIEIIIREVKFSGYEDVYDMTVPGTHNFSANGMFVHNCTKVGDTAAVYGEFFNEDVHVKKTEKEFFEIFQRLEGVEMTPYFYRITGFDFGGNFACVRLVKSPTNKRRFYILDVYFNKKDVTINEHVKELKKRIWWGKGREVMFGDPAQRQDIIEFNSRGIPIRQAIKEVFNGIDLVKSLLENQEDGEPGLIINGVRCEALITEFGSYSHKVGKDGLPDKDSIYKCFDHTLDSLRYALFTFFRGGGRVRTGTRRF